MQDSFEERQIDGTSRVTSSFMIISYIGLRCEERIKCHFSNTAMSCRGSIYLGLLHVFKCVSHYKFLSFCLFIIPGFFFFVLFFAFCKKFFLKTDKKLRSKIIFNLESIIG